MLPGDRDVAAGHELVEVGPLPIPEDEGVGTGHMCRMQARTFQSAAAQVEPAKIRLPKVAVGEVDIAHVHAAQIDAAKVAPAKIARLTRLAAPIELLAAPFAQQQVQGIG